MEDFSKNVRDTLAIMKERNTELFEKLLTEVEGVNGENFGLVDVVGKTPNSALKEALSELSEEDKIIYMISNMLFTLTSKLMEQETLTSRLVKQEIISRCKAMMNQEVKEDRVADNPSKRKDH